MVKVAGNASPTLLLLIVVAHFLLITTRVVYDDIRGLLLVELEIDAWMSQTVIYKVLLNRGVNLPLLALLVIIYTLESSLTIHLQVFITLL